MISSIKLEGIDKLSAELKKILLTHKENDVRKALKRSATIIMDEAKIRVPRAKSAHTFERANGEKVTIQPGYLRDSIQILPKWSKDPMGVYVAPRASKRKKLKINAFYAAWVEYGTAAHNLGYKGKYVSGKGADHPGSRPKPYMRPAYDTKAQVALNAAVEDIAKMILAK